MVACLFLRVLAVCLALSVIPLRTVSGSFYEDIDGWGGYSSSASGVEVGVSSGPGPAPINSIPAPAPSPSVKYEGK